MKNNNKKEIQEQIQEDILTILDSCDFIILDTTFNKKNYDKLKTNLCQIIIDNFKNLK